MPGSANDLQGVLDGYSKFCREKDLAPAVQQPHLVRWVREFLLFAQTHRGYSFEQTLDLFLSQVGGSRRHQAVAASAGGQRRSRLPLPISEGPQGRGAGRQEVTVSRRGRHAGALAGSDPATPLRQQH